MNSFVPPHLQLSGRSAAACRILVPPDLTVASQKCLSTECIVEFHPIYPDNSILRYPDPTHLPLQSRANVQPRPVLHPGVSPPSNCPALFPTVRLHLLHSGVLNLSHRSKTVLSLQSLQTNYSWRLQTDQQFKHGAQAVSYAATGTSVVHGHKGQLDRGCQEDV